MPTPDATERMARIRARATAHDEAIESVKWPTAAQLAARWNVSLTTVYEIPRERLPYKEFGGGQKPRRRYRPTDVAAFEADDTAYTTAKPAKSA
jgi:hypothetical protein